MLAIFWMRIFYGVAYGIYALGRCLEIFVYLDATRAKLYAGTLGKGRIGLTPMESSTRSVTMLLPDLKNTRMRPLSFSKRSTAVLR